MEEQEKAQIAGIEPTERRQQSRIIQPHAAEVLVQEPGGEATFHAVLVNTSDGGMCIRHWRRDLAIGQTARISSPAFPETKARVIWNWTVGPVVISGLQRLESHSGAYSSLLHNVANFGHAVIPNPGTPFITKRARLRAYLVGGAAGTLLIAGWYFRAALWHLWSQS